MSRENEYALIGTLLADNSSWAEVRGIISAGDFTDIRAGVVFGAVDKMGGKADLVMVSDWLRNNGHKDLVGFVTNCADIGMPSFVMEYTRNIREESNKRKLVDIADQVKTGVLQSSSQEIIRDIEIKFISLYDDSDKTFRHGKEMTTDYVRRMAMLIAKGADISGLTTGFRCLDLVTDGFKPCELIIIGARPSIGKTSLMCAFADHMAVECRKNVAIFSIESPETELMHKLVSQRAEVSSKKLRIGKFTAWDEEHIRDAIEKYSAANIAINDICIIDILKIRAQIKRLINDGHRPDIVFLDYLQIVEVERGTDTFATKIGRVTQGLKNIAKELSIPVVVLAQINRNNEERPPRLIDLKDSGAIEAIADMVILLHREEFYKKENCEPEKKGKVDVDVAKNRNGQTLLIELNWHGEYTKFSEAYTGSET